VRHLLAVGCLCLCACGSGEPPSGFPLAPGFAGTWGGRVEANLGVDGTSFNYPYGTALVITVTGNAASISGVCLDGTGAVQLTGTEAAASAPSSFSCGPTEFDGCSSTVFTYETLSVTLTSASTLSLKGSGTAKGGDTSYVLATTLDAVLAAPGTDRVPPWDLRFKPLGKPLLAEGEWLVASSPGSNEAETFAFSDHGSVPWGLVGGGGIVVNSFYSAPQTAIYQDSAASYGGNCGLEDFLSGSTVVTELYGNPSDAAGVCAFVGVGLADGVSTFEYLLEDAVSESHILNALAASPEARSFVVTAISQVDAGLYTYVAESLGRLPDGGFEAFETRIATPLLADLTTEASDMADAGFIITASAWQGELYYTLVGTRKAGSRATYSTLTMATRQQTVVGDAQTMLAQGYTPVSAMDLYVPLPDGGLAEDAWLIGEK
jgi:hypothetical protein